MHCEAAGPRIEAQRLSEHIRISSLTAISTGGPRAVPLRRSSRCGSPTWGFDATVAMSPDIEFGAATYD